MLAGSLLLGGLLPLSPSARDHWAPSGAWRLPVGDPYALSTERPLEPGPFFLLRGVEWDGGRASHQGADIGCGASGGFVRAAAAGLVVRSADHGDHGGYGTHVVLAHRLPGGVLAYSVYAHLRTASVRVRPGQFVPAGTRLGRVGMTGRATTPHLHFEVRTTSDPGERWEKANVEDPLAFVDERMPSHRADTTGIAAYLEWAECASLLPVDAQGDEALSRERWWRMLAVAGHGSLLDPGLPAEELRDSLVAAGLLAPGAARRGAGYDVEWPELARDLNLLRQTGPRGGPAPLRRARHREVCSARFGSPAPARRTSELSGREGRPSLTDAVLLLADLAGPPPEPAKKRPAATPKKSGTTRADSLARARAGSDTAARAKAPRSKRDSVAVAKPAPARADSAAKPKRPPSAKSDTASKQNAVKAPAVSGGKPPAKPATAKPKADSAAKPRTAAARADSAVKPKPAATKADSAAKPRPAAKADSLAKASRRAPADTALRAKAAADTAKGTAKPKAPPGPKPKPKPAPAPTPARADTASS